MERILIFAGTTEGRRLYELLTQHGIPADISVATEYGSRLIEGGANHIYVGRLLPDQMKNLIVQEAYTLVIDATHPYAAEVTANIQSVCGDLAVPCIRLLREGSKNQDVIACATTAEAIKYLGEHKGNVLSTIGSKELPCFTSLENFETRIVARILPLPDAVNACLQLGWKGGNLICMQGPFSYEMNLAMLKQYDCKYLLTKDSGKAGGFEEKIKAAKAANAKVILIDRPKETNGLSFEKVIEIIEKKCRIKISGEQPGGKRDYFPLFVNLENKNVLVAGGGTVATRRIKTLCRFSCRVKVVSPEITEELAERIKSGEIDYEQRTYQTEDLRHADVVVAATDSREVNRQIGNDAKEKGLFVSVADSKEECNFYFPAIIEDNDVVIGITSQGKSHKTVSGLSEIIRGILRNED